MKKKIIFLFLVLFYSTSILSVDQAQLTHIGSSKLEYGFFSIDLYNLSYFKNKNGQQRLLKLQYLRDIASKHSKKGWSEGFKSNLTKNRHKYSMQIRWILDNTPDMHKGDIFQIYLKGKNETLFIKNKKILAHSKDPKVQYLAHLPWLGPIPVDKGVKKELLGKK